jgi:hypothetical protein
MAAVGGIEIAPASTGDSAAGWPAARRSAFEHNATVRPPADPDLAASGNVLEVVVQESLGPHP